MYVSIFQNLALTLGAAFITGISFFASTATAQDDGKVLFLSEYLHGNYYYAPLGEIDRNQPRSIRPKKLRLPRGFRANVELGNHDVSFSGEEIVFAARDTSDYDWNIYTGTLDLGAGRIRKVERIIRNIDMRDEDPRFSWDGTQIVYKCGGNICLYPDLNYENPVVSSWCELWAPAFDSSGYRITYTKRCDGPLDDRIWQYDLLTGTESPIPNAGSSTDRFSQFLDDGRIVYSHLNLETARSSLWIYESGAVSPLHDQTVSDDDPYPDKHDRNHMAFIGWKDDGYDLYVYRQSRGDAVQLSDGISIYAPVLFR